MSDTELAPVEPAIAENSLKTDAEADANTPIDKEADPAPAAKEASDKPDKVQERFDKLTREKYNERRRADRLEFELQQLKQAKPPEPPATAPTLESTGYDEGKYQAAMREYLRHEAKTAVKEEVSVVEKQRQAAERDIAFQSKVNVFAKDHPDFHEKVFENSDQWSCTDAMAELIKASDFSPQVAFHLASNPELSHKIAQLPENLQAREIGRIEARFENPAPPKAVSKAPPPPQKIEASAPSLDDDPEKMSIDKWLVMRNKQIAKARGNR